MTRERRQRSKKELMRHASRQTTMNIYGKAMTDSKRRAHSKVVELILKPRKTAESASGDHIVAAVGA
jgi:integrase